MRAMPDAGHATANYMLHRTRTHTCIGLNALRNLRRAGLGAAQPSYRVARALEICTRRAAVASYMSHRTQTKHALIWRTLCAVGNHKQQRSLATKTRERASLPQHHRMAISGATIPPWPLRHTAAEITRFTTIHRKHTTLTVETRCQAGALQPINEWMPSITMDQGFVTGCASLGTASVVAFSGV